MLTAFISPFRTDRESIRSLFDPGDFIEVYICCPVEVCASRDKKGLYRKAQEGKIDNFTGISSPYEPPLNPDLIINSDKTEALDASQRIFSYIEMTGILHTMPSKKQLQGSIQCKAF